MASASERLSGPQDQAARQGQRYDGGGRYPVPCGHGADPMSGMANVTRTGWRAHPIVRLPERYRPRSSATASATTATSEAMVYGFGSHPSGA
jgi:hypothetical protein